MGDGLDYPETFDDTRPFETYQLEIPHMRCMYCDYQGEMANAWGWKNAGVCADCLDAYERESPEELAITLGDMSVDDVREDGGLWEDAFRPYKGFMGR